MSYLANLLTIYRTRLADEQSQGFVFPDTIWRLREISAMLIGGEALA